MAFNNLGRAIIVIRFEYHRGTAPGSWFLPCGRSSDGQWKKVFSPFWPHSCPYSDQMLKLITWIIPSSKFLIFFSSEVYHQPQNIPQISYFLALGQPKTSRKKKKKNHRSWEIVDVTHLQSSPGSASLLLISFGVWHKPPQSRSSLSSPCPPDLSPFGLCSTSIPIYWPICCFCALPQLLPLVSKNVSLLFYKTNLYPPFPSECHCSIKYLPGIYIFQLFFIIGSFFIIHKSVFKVSNPPNSFPWACIVPLLPPSLLPFTTRLLEGLIHIDCVYFLIRAFICVGLRLFIVMLGARNAWDPHLKPYCLWWTPQICPCPHGCCDWTTPCGSYFDFRTHLSNNHQGTLKNRFITHKSQKVHGTLRTTQQGLRSRDRKSRPGTCLY